MLESIVGMGGCVADGVKVGINKVGTTMGVKVGVVTTTFGGRGVAVAVGEFALPQAAVAKMQSAATR